METTRQRATKRRLHASALVATIVIVLSGSQVAAQIVVPVDYLGTELEASGVTDPSTPPPGGEHKLSRDLRVAYLSQSNYLGISVRGWPVVAPAEPGGDPLKELDFIEQRLESKPWARPPRDARGKPYRAIKELIVFHTARPPAADAFPGFCVTGWESFRDGSGYIVLEDQKPPISPEELAHIVEHPRVRYAQGNYPYSAQDFPLDDPYGQDQWGLAQIEAPKAWSVTTGSEVVVAVIDSGVDYRHPDLAGNMWINPKLAADVPLDDGYGNDRYGYDFIDDDDDPMDLKGHGTFTAGIIAAVAGNGEGGAGVAPKARIMAIRAVRRGEPAPTLLLNRAINYAVRHGASVINMSLGGAVPYDLALHRTIDDAPHALFVASAGNNVNTVAHGIQQGDNDEEAFYPASFDSPHLISVLGVECTGPTPHWTCAKSIGSRSGASSVDLGAPGVKVLSTWCGDTTLSNKCEEKPYKSRSGTSAAAAFVSGAAALLWGHDGLDTPAEIRDALLENTHAVPELGGHCATAGTLNLGFISAQ